MRITVWKREECYCARRCWISRDLDFGLGEESAWEIYTLIGLLLFCNRWCGCVLISSIME